MAPYTRAQAIYIVLHLCNEKHITIKRSEVNLYILTRKIAQDVLLRNQVSIQN